MIGMNVGRARSRSWFNAGMDAWSLGAEASLVASMRIARMSAGDAQAGNEARLMVREKIAAAAELQLQLMSAALTLTPLGATNRALSHYRRKVAANKRRLSR